MSQQYENLDTIDRQAKAIADLKVARLLLLREQILKEIGRRQNNVEHSAQSLANFILQTQDPFDAPPLDVKVFERF